MKKTMIFAMSLAFTLYGGLAQAAEEIKFAGCSTSTLSYMFEVAKEYEKKTGIRIDVRGGGATLGIKSAAAGTVDMGGSCRHLKDEKERGMGVDLIPVGYDAVVFVVHPENPIKNITTNQMIDIFEGKIKNWKEVGGKDQPIIIVERKSRNAGVRMSLREMLGGYDIQLTSSAIKVQSTAEVEKEMEKNPFSFGVSGSGSARQRNLKILKFNGIVAKKSNFLNGNYPFVRPLYLVTKGERSKKMKTFFTWLLSEEGQRVVGKNAISLREYKGDQKALFHQDSGILKPRLVVQR